MCIEYILEVGVITTRLHMQQQQFIDANKRASVSELSSGRGSHRLHLQAIERGWAPKEVFGATN